VFIAVVGAFAASGCARRPARPTPSEQQEMADRIAAFSEHLLEPARVAPPSVERGPKRASAGPVTATVELVLPEEESWNRWRDGSARLFNNRVALLFDVRIDGPGPITWDARQSTLALNDEHTVLTAAEDAEILLAGLLVHALLSEEWGVECDLVDRTRAAGPFRAAYLSPSATEAPLEGLLGFQLWNGEEALGDLHVAAMRIRLAVEAGGEPHTVEITME
jgi:hypothetical protein